MWALRAVNFSKGGEIPLSFRPKLQGKGLGRIRKNIERAQIQRADTMAVTGLRLD